MQEAKSDPTYGGRFTKGAKAWAVFPADYKPHEYTLSGRVRASKCSATSCSLSPRAGVTVVARGPGRGQAVTGSDGRYAMKLKEGGYSVALSGIKGDPRTASVSLEHNTGGVDFTMCGTERTTSSAASLCGTFTLSGHLKNSAGLGVEVFVFSVHGTTTDGTKVTKRLSTDHHGAYDVTLPGGEYQVDISLGAEPGRWSGSVGHFVTLERDTSGFDGETGSECNGNPVTRLGTPKNDTIRILPGLEAAPKVSVVSGTGTDVVDASLVSQPISVCAAGAGSVIRAGNQPAWIQLGDGTTSAKPGSPSLSSTGSITVGNGNDSVLYVAPGNVTIRAGSGDDSISVAGPGKHDITVGAGTLVNSAPGRDKIDVGGGDDRVTFPKLTNTFIVTVRRSRGGTSPVVTGATPMTSGTHGSITEYQPDGGKPVTVSSPKGDFEITTP